MPDEWFRPSQGKSGVVLFSVCISYALLEADACGDDDGSQPQFKSRDDDYPGTRKVNRQTQPETAVVKDSSWLFTEDSGDGAAAASDDEDFWGLCVKLSN